MKFARLVPLVAVAAGILAVACSDGSDAPAPSGSTARGARLPRLGLFQHRPVRRWGRPWHRRTVHGPASSRYERP